MKQIFKIVFLLFSLSFFGQNDTISVENNLNISEVFTKSKKILYRGIANEIFINVPNIETLTAISQGIYIENKKYYISPGSGTEQKLILRFKDSKGEFITEEHLFKIQNVPSLLGYINNRNCESCTVNMTRKELKNAIISLKFPDVFLDINFNVTGFNIIPLKKIKSFQVDGNLIDEVTFKTLNKLKMNSEFFIWGFKFNHNLGGALICGTSPIRVKIID
jgi:hypothetical protein